MGRKVTKFRSKFEARLYEEAYEQDKKLRYEPANGKLEYVLQGKYLPDLILSNGVIIEAKGYFDYTAQRKMKAVKLANPGADIRFVFMRAATKIAKGSKVTYGEWATNNGFPWAEHSIPFEWFKELPKNEA